MINELICIIQGHNWINDSRHYFHAVIDPRDRLIIVGIAYKICLRCGREEIQRFFERELTNDD